MTSETFSDHVLVVGAGLTGLAAAFELQRSGARVRILEKTSHPGGVVQSLRAGGFLAEAGPNTLLLENARMERLMEDLGLAGEMVGTAPEARRRYVVKGGLPRPVPMAPGDLIRRPLFSPVGLGRAMLEPLFGLRRSGAGEETVAHFFRRHFGREVLDWAVDPFVSGIYAGDPEKLSVEAAFPELSRLEQRYRSVLGGVVMEGLRRKLRGEKKFRRRSISFHGGMETLARALAKPLAGQLHTSVNIKEIREEPGQGWRVAWEESGRFRVGKARCLLLALPAWALRELPLPHSLIHDHLFRLEKITWAPVATLALGFHREDVRHPLDGFGMLVPRREKSPLLGTLFTSSLFPGRAPEGYVMLASFAGGVHRPDLADLRREELQEMLLPELGRLLGVRGNPVFSAHFSWPRAIPQYYPGHARLLEAASSAEKAFPGLFLGGSWRGGISAGACMRSGLELAGRMLHALSQPASSSI